MGKVLKWAGIGCGGFLGLIVLLVIIAAIVSGGSDDEPEVSVADDISTGSSSDGSQTPDGKERTNPLPRGYSITHNNLRITILDVSYSTSEGGLFASLEDNHKWATVKIRLEAVGDPNKTYSYNTINFRLVGDRGVIYDDWVAVAEDALGSGELFGGGTVEGGVVRQVHEDDTNIVLIHSPAFAGSRYLALESDP